MWIECSSLELFGDVCFRYLCQIECPKRICASRVKKLRGTEMSEFQATSNNHTYQPTWPLFVLLSHTALYYCLTQLLAEGRIGDSLWIITSIFLYLFNADMQHTWFKKRGRVAHHQEDGRRRCQEHGCITFWNYNLIEKCLLFWCMLVSYKRCTHALSYSVATSLFCYQTFSSMTTMIQYVHNDRSL
jgi:hypothetical protein